MDIEEEIRNRISDTENLINKVKDKTTFAYLVGVYSLKCDYESIGDMDSACHYADIVIDLLQGNKVVYKDNAKNREKINNMWVTSYDTKARNGDFESFCIALEWNRPIHKQFYLPRAKLLKKHGVIQGIQDLIDDKLDLLVLNCPPRVGKNQSNDTLVLTKNGWKKHGDLQVGDYVLNHKGDFVKVLATSEDFPIEYSVKFSNGEVSECHGNHEWLVYDRHARKEKIVETKYMIGKIRDADKNSPNNTHTHFRFSLPIKNFAKGIYKNLCVDPYTLGAWLGDGTNKAGNITLDKKDEIIAKTIESNGYKISNIQVHSSYGTCRYHFKDLYKGLQMYGMCYSRKKTDKYIPEEYLTSSIEQRLELLAGLLDTDGSLSKKEHRYHYSTTDEKLKDGFVSLVSTFGWRCSIVEREPVLSSSNIQGRKKVYDIGFNPTIEIPCRVKRKKLKEFSKPRRITITSIEPIKEKKWGKCIQVEGGIYLVGKTMIPTHNSTLGLFLQVLLGGLSPDESILGSGHSVSLIQSFYSEIINIIESEEYRYHDIFPNNKIVNKSAEYLYIDLNSNRRFHTYNYVSIESGGTGKVQAERLLYCDDLIKNVEQANNPATLEKLYYNYTGTIKDRKIQRLCKDGKYRPCPEIHICTPWSLHDVTSRVVENAKMDDDSRVRIVSIPCYDENGESNFMYDYGKGFNTKYYKDMEIADDPVIFSAKYLMKPIERDGLLFNKDNVSFYNELPGESPDRVIAYADVSHGGEDYFSMPIGYQYGNEIYIEKVLFRNKFGGDDYIRPLVRDFIKNNKVTRCGVEKNNGGDYFSTLMGNDLRDVGYHCNITTHNAPTNKSKLDRILACQNEIKGVATENNTYRIYFKNPELIKGDKDYMEAMHNLYSWNQNPSMQNKQHDDFPDSLAGMITNVLGGSQSGMARINVSASQLGI